MAGGAQGRDPGQGYGQPMQAGDQGIGGHRGGIGKDKVTVCCASQAAIKRLRNTSYGPGQALARKAIRYARQLTWERVAVEIRWVPEHKGLASGKRGGGQ